mmetsp:Transcript_19860/g.63211  ORF Transcript_19860/g.63211 Transcript_19860/m.63211 type:complete len:273 (-) Transcript_19860:240-1058(-)
MYRLRSRAARSISRSFSSLYRPQLCPAMAVHVWSRPVAAPHSQQKACPQRHPTRLQPPFFSTSFPHLGHGLVCAVIQLLVSDSSLHFCSHSFHMRHEHGECGTDRQLKQNLWPHEHSGSQKTSPSSTCTAKPQCGTLGHHLAFALSSMYDSSRHVSYLAAVSSPSSLTSLLTIPLLHMTPHLGIMHLIILLWPSLICTLKCVAQQVLQKVCPQSMVLVSLWSESQKHTPQVTSPLVPAVEVSSVRVTRPALRNSSSWPASVMNPKRFSTFHR